MYYDPEKTGTRIQQMRKNANMKMEDLSEKLSVSVRQIRRIEKGESSGSLDLLIEIAVVFDVSLDYLILGKVSGSSDVKKVLQHAIGYLSELEEQI